MKLYEVKGVLILCNIFLTVSVNMQLVNVSIFWLRNGHHYTISGESGSNISEPRVLRI